MVCCVGAWPLSGGHGNTVVWLMTTPLALTMWWKPGRVRVPLHWIYTTTMGGAYTMHTDCTLQMMDQKVPAIVCAHFLGGVHSLGLNKLIANGLPSIPRLSGWIFPVDG